tara:strand:+ start:410 stop:643 length:234 start_codon:yes stop_codon:yes gene_type:complete
MQFDTVHEYHFYNKDNDIYYCEDHETLIIASNGDNTNRLMIEGIKADAVKSFVNIMNKKSLNENLEDHNHSTDAVEA